MKNILFVCIENSNRSQMAQAFAIMLGDGKVNALSAGSNPSGKINPKAIAAMQELNYDLSQHDSKSINEIPDVEFEATRTQCVRKAVQDRPRLQRRVPAREEIGRAHV